MINELAKHIHENNKAKGFYNKEKNIGEMLALIHSEVSEALEADRNNRFADIPEYIKRMDGDMPEHCTVGFIRAFEANIKDTFEDELADVIIRVMDLAAFKGIDLDNHIRLKVEYNKHRSHKHGKKY